MQADTRQYTEFLNMLRQCESTLMRVCLCFTNRSSDSIRDLYQEIACNLWESWPRFRGDSNASVWATRIALNVAGQEIRKRRRLPQFVELDTSTYATIADEAADRNIQQLYQLIDQLDDDTDRKLLFLYLDHHRFREIAEITGTTENAIKQRFYRIRKQLKILKQLDNE